MEAIKTITYDSAKRSLEFLMSASPVSKNQDRISDNNYYKKDPADADRINKTIKERINRIAEAMDKYVKSMKCDINIQVHEKTGDIIVKVISQNDGKVIREIPPKELLDLAARIEEMAGALFDEKV